MNWRIGDELTTSRLNARAPRARVAPGSGLAAIGSGPGSALARPGKRPIWATLSGVGPAYSFTQVGGPRTGTAWEVNGVASLAGRTARLWPDPFGAYRFQWVASGPAAPPAINCNGCQITDRTLALTLVLAGCDAGDIPSETNQRTYDLTLTYTTLTNYWGASLTTSVRHCPTGASSGGAASMAPGVHQIQFRCSFPPFSTRPCLTLTGPSRTGPTYQLVYAQGWSSCSPPYWFSHVSIGGSEVSYPSMWADITRVPPP